MSEDTTEIRIYDILISLWKHKVMILALMVVGIIAGTLFAGAKFVKDMRNPVYTAKASMVFNSETQDGIYAVAGSNVPTQNDFTLSNYLVDTAAYIAKSQSLYYEVMEKLNYNLDYDFYRQAVSVTRYEETSILLLSVTCSEKFQAVLIANEIVEVLPNLLQETLGLGSVSLIDKAETAIRSGASLKITLIFLGAAAGGMMGAGIIALMAILHPTFMDSTFIEELLKEEVLAEIPYNRIRKGESFPVRMAQITGVYMESFQLLSRKLISAAEKNNIKRIMVTSAGAAEGKTSVSIHLAQALATRGYRVLLVDGDTRNPNIGKKYGMEGYRKHSLNAVFHNETAMEEAPLEVSDHLFILQSYETGKMLLLTDLKRELCRLEEQYDFILYDTPPSALMADAFHMKDAVDTALLVIRQGGTSAEEIQKIRVSYEQVGIPLIGCVLNAVQKGKIKDPYLNKYYRTYGMEKSEWKERTKEEEAV